ncbi:unnamed protein product [Bursaphelenchus okinawaensis]|uniref:Cyclic nucleotide-binding domain-containing protein n=1 Tax=Bursaphelenchus okinawaensis TaxID=465554 RepID=A0A811KRI8_9BILA|nr:unnamed protein product [Bursaphelenchus okinawaensis]CAG9109215.1 unnamed protein product [Bursaphelenchus okinawaensis]
MNSNASTVESGSTIQQIPEVVIPSNSAPQRLWKRGFVVGMLKNIFNGENGNTTFQRQLSDIDTTGQSNGELLSQNSNFNIAFDEQSLCVFYWDIVIFFVNMYNLFSIPFPAFDDVFTYHYNLWMSFNIIADIIFLVDIPARCFVSTYVDGLIERNIKIIAKQYIKSADFILDIVSVLPTDAVIQKYRYLHMIRIFTLAKTYRVYYFLNRVQMHTNWPNVIVMAKVIIPIVFIFHWNACGYFALSLYFEVDDSETNNWPFAFTKIMDPVVSECNDMPWSLQCDLENKILSIENTTDYLKISFYWSSMTITTLGEQPEPDNNTENMYEVVNTVIGILIFGAIMGSVAEIVKNANRVNRELKSNQDLAKIYMQNRRVEESVQKKVFGYFDFTIGEQWVFDDPTRDSLLTTALQHEIQTQVLSKYLRNMALFTDSTDVFLQELIMHFHTQLYGPNDCLCTTGDICREVFIVETGFLIEISKNEIIRKLKKGDVFGELNMIYQPEHRHEDRRSTTLISVGFSEVYVLPVEKFRKLLKDFPDYAKALDFKTREMLEAQNLLRSDEEMMNARYRDESYHDVNDRLEQIKKQLTTLSFGLSTQSNVIMRHYKELDKRVQRLEFVRHGNRTVNTVKLI